MLRNVLKRVEGDVITSFVKVNHLNTIFPQIVRWRRKPRWLPVAKSKLFRVPERKRLPVDERDEILRLYNNYRTEMKSIRQFLADQNKELNEEIETLPAENEEEELQMSIQLNEKWNNEIRKIREETLAREKEAQMEKILKRLEKSEIALAERKREVEEIVRAEKERAESYITPDNIDDAIDKALDDHVDYNFAVDSEGTFYHGRNVKPPKIQVDPRKEINQLNATSA